MSQDEVRATSAAIRVHALFEAAMTKNGGLNCFEMWAEVFSISSEVQGVERQNCIGDLVTAIYTELQLVRAALLNQGVPPDLVVPYVSRVENALAVGHLNNRWDQTVQGHLGPDAVLALKWFAYVMVTESAAATDEDVAEIARLVAELEAALARPGVPSALAALVRRQIDSFKSALSLFKVNGVRPIRDAARKMAVDIHLDADEIRHAAATGDANAVQDVRDSLKRVWDKSASVAGDLDKFGKGAKMVVEVTEFLTKLLGNG